MKAFLLLLAVVACLFTTVACSSRGASGVDGGRYLPELAPGGRLNPDRSNTAGGR